MADESINNCRCEWSDRGIEEHGKGRRGNRRRIRVSVGRLLGQVETYHGDVVDVGTIM
jgi:hypothetical protein